MLSRRQFCGVLGGTMVGTVYAGSKSVLEEKDDLKSVPCQSNGFLASKIRPEQWSAELRHKSAQARRDELQKRFAAIRACSEAVLFAGAEGIPVVFQGELTCTAKEAGLRLLVPVENPDVAWAVLDEIQADSSEFTTLVFPLEEVGRQIQIAASPVSQAVCGYWYTRFLRRSAVTIPQAVVLFEASRCLWETYVSLETHPAVSSKSRPVSRDCVDREYARLIDRTRVRLLSNKKRVKEQDLSR